MQRILVVDDDAMFRALLRVMLVGYEVQEAVDGKAGLANYRRARSDVVLMDILMPEQEGLQTIRELRDLDPEVKIVAMSGSGTGPRGHLNIALRFGARRILHKPFSREELVAAVTEVLKTPS
jgi:two-component system chemotaxis response regulator CheY